MVYDIPRNFIGDMHWKQEGELQEGDEISLEKAGVLVQVAESTGMTETDLSEVKHKKGRASSDKAPSSPAARQTPRAPASAAQKPTQLKHKSLNALLGTPKGPIGKAALPAKSPFQVRQEQAENEEWENGRPSKRLKSDKGGPWNVTRVTKTLNSKEQPLSTRTVDSAREQAGRSPQKKTLLPGQQKLGTKEIIDISDDVDDASDKFLPGFSSEGLMPPSSPPVRHVSIPTKPAVRSSSPAFQTQRPKAAAVSKKNTETSNVSAVPVQRSANQHGPAGPQAPVSHVIVEESSKRPPDRAKKRIAEEAAAAARATKSPSRTGGSKFIALQRSAGATKRTYITSGLDDDFDDSQTAARGQGLRLAASAPKKKKKLLCQESLSRTPSIDTQKAADSLLSATQAGGPIAKKSQKQLLEERLALVGKRRLKKVERSSESPDPMDTEDRVATETAQAVSNMMERSKSEIEGVSRPGASRPQTPLEASAVVLGRLDQTLATPDRAISLPQKEVRPFRRVVSETDKAPSSRLKRAPGAPVMFTKSPSPVKRAADGSTTGPTPSPSPMQPAKAPMPPPKPRGKQPIKRTVSLDTRAGGVSAVILGRPFKGPNAAPAPKEPETAKDLGPWSREAFDLFIWRPPGWNEEEWRLNEEESVVGTVKDTVQPHVAGLSGGVDMPSL